MDPSAEWVREAQMSRLIEAQEGLESMHLIPGFPEYDQDFSFRYGEAMRTANRSQDRSVLIRFLEDRIGSGKADAGVYYLLVENLEDFLRPENLLFEKAFLMHRRSQEIEAHGSTDLPREVSADSIAANAAYNREAREKIRRYSMEAYEKFPSVPSARYLAAPYLPKEEGCAMLRELITTLGDTHMLSGLSRFRLESLESSEKPSVATP